MLSRAGPLVKPLPTRPRCSSARPPQLAADKKIAYDFFRVLLRGRHLDQAEKYMKDDYIQHNPNADTGIVGFKAYFSKLGGPQAIPDALPGLANKGQIGEHWDVATKAAPPSK